MVDLHVENQLRALGLNVDDAADLTSPARTPSLSASATTLQDARDSEDINDNADIVDGEGEDEASEEIERYVEGVTAVISELRLA